MAAELERDPRSEGAAVVAVRQDLNPPREVEASPLRELLERRRGDRRVDTDAAGKCRRRACLLWRAVRDAAGQVPLEHGRLPRVLEPRRRVLQLRAQDPVLLDVAARGRLAE